MSKILLIIPTYNERENIVALLAAIGSRLPDIHVLVVDDGSPDGTALSVRDWSLNNKNVFVLERAKKEGLGRAYVAGFEWALSKDYQWVGQMDADHSHRVEDLATIIQYVEKGHYDFIIGSRWVDGGGIRNWEWSRILLSRAGNLYARLLLGGHFRDWTGGFNFWRMKVLQALQITSLESQGYAFQIEMKYRAFRLNFLGFEVPIVFEERRQGQSKMSLRIILEALLRVWKLKSKFQVS